MSENKLPYVKALESYRIIACECIHLVRRCHFRSHDKDGDHTMRSAVVKNPILHANMMALSSIVPELWAIEVYVCGNRHFGRFRLL